MGKTRAMYLVFVCAVAATAAAGQPVPGWSDQFATGDLNDGVVRSMTVFDEDGAGPGLPCLFACGTFRTAGIGGPWVGGIARWDGMRWTDVGGGSPSPNLGINALIVFDEDGPGPEPEALYVGGDTVNLGGVRGVYRWDGSTWTSVIRLRTGNLVGLVNDFAVFDEDGDGPELPKLFAAGRLSVGNESGGYTVARWDGVRWTAVGNVRSYSGQANALAVYDEDGSGPIAPALFAGGTFRFDEDGPTFVTCAKWDGQSWSQVGEGISGEIRDLAVFDPDGDYPGQGHLYAAGSINVPGMPPNQKLMRWDGQTWSAVPDSLEVIPTALAVLDVDAQGLIPESLITNTNFIHRWDGYSWNPLQPVLQRWGYDLIRSLGQYDDDGAGGRDPVLFIGGGFWQGSDAIRGITQWNGQETVGIGNGIWRGPQALKVLDPDSDGPLTQSLVAVGELVAAGNAISKGIACWNGETWQSFGSFDSLVDIRAIDVVDFEGHGAETTRLIIGGGFRQINGQQAGCVAYWDGQSWTPAAQTIMGSPGTGPYVSLLRSFDLDGPGGEPPSIYAAGQFSSIDGVTCNSIARWDGQSWFSLGEGLSWTYSASPKAMELWDPDGDGPQKPLLVVGGYMDHAGGVSVSGIAAWNGDNWMPLGNAVSGVIDSILIVGPGESEFLAPGLFVSGSVTFADETGFSGLMRLENGSWSLIAGRKSEGYSWIPVGGLTDLSATAMKLVDIDGPGGSSASLFILGGTQIEGEEISWQFAKWDGSMWSGLGRFAGISSSPKSLEVFDEDGDGPNSPGLYVGGRFNSVEGIQSVGIARWGLRAPYFVRQPGDLQSNVGESALFNVKTGGENTLQYQWRLNGQELVDGDRVLGAATQTLRISNLRLADRGQYDVVITNSAGIKTSRAAQLDIACNTSRNTPDLNHDQIIDGHDVQFMIDAMLSLATSDAGLCTADLNGDLLLDAEDLHLFVGSLLSQ